MARARDCGGDLSDQCILTEMTWHARQHLSQPALAGRIVAQNLLRPSEEWARFIGFQCSVVENSGLFSEWSTEDEERSWFHRASANTSEEA